MGRAVDPVEQPLANSNAACGCNGNHPQAPDHISSTKQRTGMLLWRPVKLLVSELEQANDQPQQGWEQEPDQDEDCFGGPKLAGGEYHEPGAGERGQRSPEKLPAQGQQRTQREQAHEERLLVEVERFAARAVLEPLVLLVEDQDRNHDERERGG